MDQKYAECTIHNTRKVKGFKKKESVKANLARLPGVVKDSSNLGQTQESRNFPAVHQAPVELTSSELKVLLDEANHAVAGATRNSTCQLSIIMI